MPTNPLTIAIFTGDERPDSRLKSTVSWESCSEAFARLDPFQTTDRRILRQWGREGDVS